MFWERHRTRTLHKGRVSCQGKGAKKQYKQTDKRTNTPQRVRDRQRKRRGRARAMHLVPCKVADNVNVEKVEQQLLQGAAPLPTFGSTALSQEAPRAGARLCFMCVCVWLFVCVCLRVCARARVCAPRDSGGGEKEPPCREIWSAVEAGRQAQTWLSLPLSLSLSLLFPAKNAWAPNQSLSSSLPLPPSLSLFSCLFLPHHGGCGHALSLSLPLPISFFPNNSFPPSRPARRNAKKGMLARRPPSSSFFSLTTLSSSSSSADCMQAGFFFPRDKI